MRTLIYVDGFNLYYGIRNRGLLATSAINPNVKYPLPTSRYKWLNIDMLCKKLRPRDEILGVKYFTARISGDYDAMQRQVSYLDALMTLPNFSIIEGMFFESNPTMQLLNPPPKTAAVIKREEKGTDVNIASHLLIDAFKDSFDCAVVITNDSDLCFPIEYIKKHLGKKVFVYNPQRRNSYHLKNASNGIFNIYTNMLKACQFPDTFVDIAGKIHNRPISWK